MAYDFRQQPAAIERNVMIWNHIRNLQPFKMSHKYRLFFHLVHYLNGQPCTAEASCYDHDLYTSLLQKAPATVTENVLLDHIVWLIQQMASVADFLTEVYDRKPQQRTEMTKGMSTPDHLAASMLTLLLTTYSRCKLTPKDTARLATIAIHLVSAFGEVESLFDRTLYALRAILRCLKTDERRHLAEHHTFAVDIMRFIDHPSSPMRENVLGFCRQLVQYSQEIAIVLMDRGLLGRMRELLVHPFIEQRSSRNEITEIMRIIDDVTATHRSDIWRVIAADVVPALYGVIDAIATDRHQLIFDFMRIVNNVAQIGALDQFAVMLPENGALRLVEAHLACGSVSCILVSALQRPEAGTCVFIHWPLFSFGLARAHVCIWFRQFPFSKPCKYTNI